MYLAHKIQLRPTKAQIGYFRKACGCKRFAYNWGLAQWKAALDRRAAGEDVGRLAARWFRDELVALKKTEFPWLADVSKHIVGMAFEDLQSAFNKFFKRQGRFPRFKKKGKAKTAFSVGRETPSTFALDGKRLRLPVIGWLNLTEAVRFQGEIK